MAEQPANRRKAKLKTAAYIGFVYTQGTQSIPTILGKNIHKSALPDTDTKRRRVGSSALNPTNL